MLRCNTRTFDNIRKERRHNMWAPLSRQQNHSRNYFKIVKVIICLVLMVEVCMWFDIGVIICLVLMVKVCMLFDIGVWKYLFPSPLGHPCSIPFSSCPPNLSIYVVAPSPLLSSLPPSLALLKPPCIAIELDFSCSGLLLVHVEAPKDALHQLSDRRGRGWRGQTTSCSG